MANPNLVNVTSILGLSTQAALTTTLTTEILACASDKLIKVNSIITVSYTHLTLPTNYSV